MQFTIKPTPEIAAKLQPGQQLMGAIDGDGNAYVYIEGETIPVKIESTNPTPSPMSFLRNLIDFGFGSVVNPASLGIRNRQSGSVNTKTLAKRRALFKRQKAARKIQRAHHK